MCETIFNIFLVYEFFGTYVDQNKWKYVGTKYGEFTDAWKNLILNPIYCIRFVLPTGNKNVLCWSFHASAAPNGWHFDIPPATK